MTNRVTGFSDLADGEKVCQILTLSASNVVVCKLAYHNFIEDILLSASDFVVYKLVCHPFLVLNFFMFQKSDLASIIPFPPLLYFPCASSCYFHGPKILIMQFMGVWEHLGT